MLQDFITPFNLVQAFLTIDNGNYRKYEVKIVFEL